MALLADIQQHGHFIKLIIIFRLFLSSEKLDIDKKVEFTFKAHEAIQSEPLTKISARESGNKTSIFVSYL